MTIFTLFPSDRPAPSATAPKLHIEPTYLVETKAPRRGAQAQASSTINSERFCTCISADLLDAIRLSTWIILRVETTAATRQSRPLRLTKSSRVAGQSLQEYRGEIAGAVASTAPRIRVLSILTDHLGPLAIDFDVISAEQQRDICSAVLSVPVLIGHEVAFDLHWLSPGLNSPPGRLLDIQNLAKLDPTVHLHPYSNEETVKRRSDLERAIRRSKDEEDWRGSSALNLLAVTWGIGTIDQSFSDPGSWCVTRLSMAHHTFCCDALAVLRGAIGRIFPQVSLDRVAQVVDGKALWHQPMEIALLRMNEASQRGLPFDVAGSTRLLKNYYAKLENAVAELTAFPLFGELSEQLASATLHPPDVKRAILHFGENNGLKAESPRSGRETISEDFMLMAGFEAAPWYGAWTRRANALLGIAGVKRYQPFVSSQDRLHPLVSYATATARFSIKSPSVQNMPRSGSFRSLIRAKSGHVILSVDFAAAELRIAAVLALRASKEISRLIAGRYSKGEATRLDWLLSALHTSTTMPDNLTFPEEPPRSEGRNRMNWILESLRVAAHRVLSRSELVLLQVFRAGVDPHLVTALDLARRTGKVAFHGSALDWLKSRTTQQRADLGQTYSADRQAAKACNFGLLYGMEASGLHRLGITQHGLRWSLAEASDARKAWFDLYPDVRLWQLWTQHCRNFKQQHGAYRTWDDRSRALQDPRWGRVNIYSVSTLTNRQFQILDDPRAALNYQNQGTAADILAQSLAFLPEAVSKMLIFSVHDELVFEVPREQAESVSASAQAAMISASDTILKGHVPMVVKSEIGPHWN